MEKAPQRGQQAKARSKRALGQVKGVREVEEDQRKGVMLDLLNGFERTEGAVSFRCVLMGRPGTLLLDVPWQAFQLVDGIELVVSMALPG